MNESVLSKLIIGSFTLVGIIALGILFSVNPSVEIDKRVPGMGESARVAEDTGSPTGPEGELITSDGVPADLSGEWPCFRGKDLDNIYKGDLEHVEEEGELEELWGLEVGEGFAGPVIKDGRVSMIDYDRENNADALRCLSLADGEEIWRYTYPVTIKRNHGISRTIPYVSDDYVICIGPKGHVTCADPISGEKKWSLDIQYIYNAEIPPWYMGQNPFVDDDRLILAVGGTSLIVALDCETGDTIWETPNPKQWKMTHSSITPIQFNEQKQYVYCASGGVVGVSAEDGEILWEFPDWQIRIANIPSPVDVGNGRIFLSGGYKAGSMMLQLEEENETIKPNTLFKLEPKQFGSPQHTPLLYKDHIYGVRPNGELVCLDLEGNEIWTSSSAHKFGLGPYMIAEPYIFVMDDNGFLGRVKATHEEFRLVDQHQILDGHDAWTPFALASGRLIARDLTHMVCLDITAN